MLAQFTYWAIIVALIGGVVSLSVATRFYVGIYLNAGKSGFKALWCLVIALMVLFIIGYSAVFADFLFIREAGTINVIWIIVAAIMLFGSIFTVISSYLLQSVISAVAKDRDKWQAYLNVIHSINLVLDKHGNVESINQFGAKELGYKAKDLIGKCWFEICISPEDRQMVREVFDKLLRGETEGVEYFENQVVRADGKIRDIAWNNTVLRDADGNISATVGSGRDVTELHLIRRELEISREHYQTIVENTGDIIYVLDAQGVLSYVSPQVINYGYEVEDVIGKQLVKFIHAEDWPGLLAGIQTVFAKGDGVDTGHEFRLRRGDGTYVWLFSRGHIIKSENNDGQLSMVGVLHDLTERKKSELELAQNADEMRRVFEASTDGLAIFNLKTRKISDCNSKLVELYGYDSKDEIYNLENIPMPISAEVQVNGQVFTAEDVQQHLANTLFSGDSKIDWIARRKDGTTFLSELKMTPFSVQDDQVILISVNDISEQRDATDALGLLVDKQRELALAVADVKNIVGGCELFVDYIQEMSEMDVVSMYVINTAEDTFVMRANRGFSEEIIKKFGRLPKDSPLLIKSETTNWENATPKSDTLPADMRNYVAMLEKDGLVRGGVLPLFYEGKKLGVICVASRKSKAVSPARLQAIELFVTSIGGTLIQLINAEKLRAEERKFRSFFENEPTYCYMVSADGMIIDINKKALQILGREKSEFINQPILRIYTKESQLKAKKVFELLKNEEETIADVELEIQCKDGSRRAVLLDVNVVKDRDGKVLHSVFVQKDITDQKQAQNKLHEMDLLKSRFIAVLTHVMRNPLSRMRWNLESVLSGRFGKVTREQESFLRGVLDMETEIDSVITNMNIALEIERGGITLEKTPSSLVSLARSVCQKYVDVYGKDISWDESYDENAPALMVDPAKMRRAISVLVDNAVRYLDDKKRKISVSVDVIDDQVRLTVVDTGIGIPPSEQGSVFARFYRASNAQLHYSEGIGLALHVAKAIVEAHGGKIGFESEEGEGCTFWLEIPIK